MANKGEIARDIVCRQCKENNKCAVHWGKECNRNGGKKVPRFKPPKRTDYPDFRPRHKREFVSEPIFTRRIAGF